MQEHQPGDDGQESTLLFTLLSPAEAEAADGQSRLRQVLKGSFLPDAINLGRREDGPCTMTRDELRQLAMKLPANTTSVTSLDLSHQNMGPDMLLELDDCCSLVRCSRAALAPQSQIRMLVVLLQYNRVSVLFTLACADCGLDNYCRFSIIFLIVKPLLNAFKLTSLDFGCGQFSRMISL